MKKFLAALPLVASLVLPSAAPALEGFTFLPVAHASIGVEIEGAGFVWVDPVGESPLYTRNRDPVAILVTHSHGDHMDRDRLLALKSPGTRVFGPPAVVEALGFGEVIKPGETRTVGKISIEAVPAYNLTPGRLDFHPRGRDNGYVLSANGKRVYFSGDTEDIPEMRALKGIDHAFVCMNLPYTMTEEQAANAVLAFRPKAVTPYHYRSEIAGVSDLASFKALLAKAKDIEVEVMAFYPQTHPAGR